VTERAKKLLQDALGLPADERAGLAAQLIDSLPVDGLHPEWTAEIEARARRANADPDGGEPWERVEARLRAKLLRT
jgi:putative addiction module component (TIGR02574 family)